MNSENWSINYFQKELLAKKLSVQELVKSCLKKIDNLQPRLNAFITVCEKEALEEARKEDYLIAKEGKKILRKYPLLGVPLAVKDLFCTKSILTTAGSKILASYYPPYDATCVARLKKAGAIIVGKTNLDAWAHGSSGENSDFGATKNPWNEQFVPGGSSSGSAVAVAAKMALVATGTDTGGSIRLPAGFCSNVGLKPTYGRVSRYGVIAMASSLDSVGHLTANVHDSALVLQVTAGKDSLDSTGSPLPVPDYLGQINTNIKGLKIGLPKEYFIKGLDKNVEQVTLKAIDKLKKLGAKISWVSLPHTADALPVYYIVQPAEVSSNLARYDGIRFGFSREKFGAEAKRRIMLGTYTLSAGYYEAYYLKAMKVRTLIRDDFTRVFKKVAVLLTPISPTLAFRLGEKTADPLKMYLSDIFTVTANLAGIPGLSVPAGFVNNLPVGIQFLGPQFSEGLLFQVGQAFENKQNEK